LAVDKYENYLFPSEGEQEEAAEKISKTYLTRNAELEINLEDKITRSVKQALKRQKATCASTGNEFDTAKRHVFSLLSVSYHGFRTSAVWDIMESKCGMILPKSYFLIFYCLLTFFLANLNIYNRDRSQGLIVNLLLSHFKKRPTLTANSQQNNTPRDAIESMVNTFCQNFLPYGLRYREMQQWEPIMKRADSVGNKSRPRSKSTGNEKKPNNGFASKFDIFGKKLARK
jgi:hypothetical protein